MDHLFAAFNAGPQNGAGFESESEAAFPKNDGERIFWKTVDVCI